MNKGGGMAIRRRCRGPCRSSRRCLEHMWFDVTHRGVRYRMPVNDFAFPRMEPGKQRPIESMEEAHDWGRSFIGEIKGRTRSANQVSRRATTDRSPGRRRVPRRLPRTTLKAGGDSQPRYGGRTDQGPEEVLRRSSSQRVGGASHKVLAILRAAIKPTHSPICPALYVMLNTGGFCAANADNPSG